jgi:hypothetical protein
MTESPPVDVMTKISAISAVENAIGRHRLVDFLGSCQLEWFGQIWIS